jgi:sortase (surface protein transpeptidase)
VATVLDEHAAPGAIGVKTTLVKLGRRVVVSAAGLAVVTAVSGGCGHSQASQSASRVPRHDVAEGAPQASRVVPVPSTSTTSVPASTAAHTKARAHTPARRRAAHNAVTHLNLSKFGTGPTSTVAPTAISIPAIGVQTSLVKLGRNADGTAQVPATVAGWYDQGPAPGQRGPAVILGHVDSLDDPGVFFKLKDLVAGDKVLVTEEGKQLTFVVQRVATYEKAAFPTQAVYGPTPARALRLITCGGPFDYATGHYYDNVVVYAGEITS